MANKKAKTEEAPAPSVQGVSILTNVPDYTSVPSGTRSVQAVVLVDLESRFLVLTSDENPMLFSIEGTRNELVRQPDVEVISKDASVSKLQEHLQGLPDIDIVGVNFPFMDHVRGGVLVDEEHQAVVLYNRQQPEAQALMLAHFLHGVHKERPYRIELKQDQVLLGQRTLGNESQSAGDVDVVKLFTVQQKVGRKFKWWPWAESHGVFWGLRFPEQLRNAIVEQLVGLARTNPLTYIEEDRKVAGKVLAGILSIEKTADGDFRHIRKRVYMQSGV